MKQFVNTNNRHIYNINVCVIGQNQTVKYAAEELAKYLGSITKSNINIIYKNIYEELTDCIWIGTFDKLTLSGMKTNEADIFTDEIYISMDGVKGVISGLNPRSVLLSVYRYLTELGCRWVRPGKDGEIIPDVNIAETKVEVKETPSYKFRGICIEGAVSLENVTEMIEWIPKVGFNSYFIQFREAFIFFKRWYNHVNNPYREIHEEFDIDLAREYVKKIADEMKKRDLIYQAVGHGWTCEPFGIPGLGWEQWQGEIDEETSKFFALVNGERKLWGGVPLNTNACYSNPEVRKKIIMDICRYAESNPEVDIIHFWLSDGCNNHCECENCAKVIPTDMYVSLLNELDSEMTRRQIKTKIVFLIYMDLIWPPVHEKINNPDRFILLFAPITRSYRASFALKNELPELPEYKRNRIELPQSVEGNVAFLKEWQSKFFGQGMDFDYHFMWAHHKDPGYVHISRILYEDIINLKNLKLDGYTSCQVQRAFFPNGLGMMVMGRTLWNSKLSFDEIVQDYFKNTYGRNWRECFEYLNKLSELYYKLNLENKEDLFSRNNIKLCDMITRHLQQFKPVIELNLQNDNEYHFVSWKHLKIHSQIWLDITNIIKLLCENETEKAQQRWSDLKNRIWLNEDECQPVFDAFNFINTIEDIIGK